MRACKVDEDQLAKWIDQASGSIRYLAPGITEKLANKICAAGDRTGEKNFVLIELDGDMDRSGYGETAGVRILMENGVITNKISGLRMAALTSPEFGVVWSPIAKCVDHNMERVTTNGIFFEGQERRKIQKLVCKLMEEDQQTESRLPIDAWRGEAFASEELDRKIFSVPDEPKVNVECVSENDVKEVEKDLREYPPRDFKEEKKLEVYQGYIGFVEIHVFGAKLSEATTLAIPKELTELGLADDLRNNLSEKMRIDLSENIDLGVREVNELVKAFRLIFTKQMGKPLGRIYKKSDWEIMQAKWNEIDYLVEAANEKISQNLDNSVTKTIKKAANDWKRALDSNTRLQPKYKLEKIEQMLTKHWTNKKRPTKVKIELFTKDLTWETLNDENVRKKIEDAYPELRETGLYKSRKGYFSGK